MGQLPLVQAPSLLAPSSSPPAACSSLSGEGGEWESCLPLSADPQGPGSMGTVRLIHNMCKTIFVQAKLKDTRLTKVLFGGGATTGS